MRGPRRWDRRRASPASPRRRFPCCWCTSRNAASGANRPDAASLSGYTLHRVFPQGVSRMPQRISWLVLAFLAVFTGIACAEPQVLRRGNQLEPESLDPHRARGAEAANILRDLYEGLTRAAPDGSIVPGVAERWEVSEDGRRYLFYLRDDARWSNGDPVTAEDFVFGLRRSVAPDTASPYAKSLGVIVNATAVLAGERA